MYRKKIYDIWVEKYGIEEADRRELERRKKVSESTKGEKNWMFGKPAPQHSGNGWKGWYKGWFFRSLRELSYMISVIEKEGHSWKSAETVEFAVKYIDFEGQERSYFADFIINEKEMVEIKPERLHNSDKVTRKKMAAIKFCDKNNLEYKLIDCPILDVRIIKNLIDNKLIIVHDRYVERMNKYFQENINEE